MNNVRLWLGRRVADWLTRNDAPAPLPMCDFGRLCQEVKPGDVILVEGRSRVSEVIKVITQSPWTHSMIYIGRLHEIPDRETRRKASENYPGDITEQLVMEALLGKGAIVTPLRHYSEDHLRICRPKGLSPGDAWWVVRTCCRRLGTDYDVRQLLDLARFFVPWTFLPRRWRSSLFQHNAGGPTRTVCSSLIAEAFSAVDFPILPFIDRGEDGSLRFFKRNPLLFTPRDFDYSPYFEIIKYPFLGLNDLGIYRKLPWIRTSVPYNDEKDGFFPEPAPAAPEQSRANGPAGSAPRELAS